MGAAAARFVSPDQLVYARGGELFAVPFSVDRLETTGPARLIASGVAEETDGAPEYGFSTAGDLVYVPGRAGGARHRLAFVDLQGHPSPISVPPMDFHRPRVSPDGRLIAFYVGAAKNNVWAFDRTRDSAARVTFGRFHEPVWIPDGRLAMAEGGPGAKRMITRSVDGTGGSDPLTEKGPDHFPESWAPDGRTLVYRLWQSEGHWDLWSFSALDSKRQPQLASPFDEMNARFSPDGRWIAYSSNDTGRPEIYVRTLAENSGRWPISTGGGSFVAWSPDGRRLYYAAPDGMWAVDVIEGHSFSVGRPRKLFSMSGFLPDFDITPDGRQFVIVQLDVAPAPTQLHLAMNLLAPPRN
jgi:serine/threonine-protein kinase